MSLQPCSGARPYLVWKGISHLSHAMHSLAEGPGLLYQTLCGRVVLFQPLQKGPGIAQHFFQSAGHLLETDSSRMYRTQAASSVKISSLRWLS